MAKVHVKSEPGVGTLEFHNGLEKVYFITPDGDRWRVYDCAFADRRMTPLSFPSSRAVYRVFKSESGWRRAHKFTRGEIREPTVSRVAAQLKSSGFVAPFPPGYRPADWRTDSRRRGEQSLASFIARRAHASAAKTLAAARRARCSA